MTAPLWRDAPIAFFRLPVCPHCGSPQRITVKSARERDGSIWRKTICMQCSKRYTLCLEPDEPPDPGSVSGPAR